MVLRVAPLLESDVAAFAAVDDAATRGWPLAMAMETSNRVAGETRQEMITGWMEKGFANPDPKVHWLKAVDDDLNGELVAAGCWKFETAPSANEEQSPVAAEVPAPSEMKGPEEPKELTGPATTGVFAGMAKGWEEFKKDFFANIDYANLQVLVTHPDHQRRGAGSMLIEWGTKKADEQGLISVLQASKAGEGLYRRHGFEVVRIREMDLRPFGVDHTELRKGMIRQPKKA